MTEWVLVPRHMTQEMLDASCMQRDWAIDHWNFMLKAAPQPEPDGHVSVGHSPGAYIHLVVSKDSICGRIDITPLHAIGLAMSLLEAAYTEIRHSK